MLGRRAVLDADAGLHEFHRLDHRALGLMRRGFGQPVGLVGEVDVVLDVVLEGLEFAVVGGGARGHRRARPGCCHAEVCSLGGFPLFLRYELEHGVVNLHGEVRATLVGVAFVVLLVAVVFLVRVPSVNFVVVVLEVA